MESFSNETLNFFSSESSVSTETELSDERNLVFHRRKISYFVFIYIFLLFLLLISLFQRYIYIYSSSAVRSSYKLSKI